MPLIKSIKRKLTQVAFIFSVLAAVAVSTGAGYVSYAYMKKDVIINDNGVIIECKTMKDTYGEILEQYNITVNDCDYINILPEMHLQRYTLNEVQIKRAVPVFLDADGKRTTILTYRDTVGEMFQDCEIKPRDIDRLEGAGLQDEIYENMELKIVRITETVEGETEAIPYETLSKANTKLDKGTEQIAQDGEDGVLEKKYKVVFEDGVEVARRFIGKLVLKNPVDMIIEFGTILNHKTARGEVVRYSKVMDVKATAYTASFKDTGKHPGDPYFGITATGIKAKKGIIAVDPKVIPLGTRVFVEFPGKTPDYGYALAADVGGAIKGNKIDLYYDSQEYVDSFGVQNARVYILLN